MQTKCCEKKAISLHDDFVEKNAQTYRVSYRKKKQMNTRFLTVYILSTKSLICLNSMAISIDTPAELTGSEEFITKVFWQDNNTISELNLNDILLPYGRDLLYHHCHTYFKKKATEATTTMTTWAIGIPFNRSISMPFS